MNSFQKRSKSEEGFKSKSRKKFIHSLNKYVLNAYYVPDTILGARNPVSDKPDRTPALIKLMHK